MNVHIACHKYKKNSKNVNGKEGLKMERQRWARQGKELKK